MTFRLRRGMIAEDGPGWAVTNFAGEPLPGRWATKEAAEVNGFLGVYLMSGIDVMHVPERPVRGPGGNGWRYKDWTFFHELGRYHVHGPNGTGRRARKIVFGFSDAVRYIDSHTEGTS